MTTIHSADFLRRTFGWLALMMVVASAAGAQPRPPDFRVTVRAFEADDFQARLAVYVAMRRDFETGLPPLIVTDQAWEIERAERLLAGRIRAARSSEQGALFSPLIAQEIRRVLQLILTASSVDTIMDENPGEFRYLVNGEYPKRRKLASTPTTVLALLPELPADIQYRFVGHHLVLLDTRANIILDRMVCSITVHSSRWWR